MNQGLWYFILRFQRCWWCVSKVRFYVNIGVCRANRLSKNWTHNRVSWQRWWPKHFCTRTVHFDGVRDVGRLCLAWRHSLFVRILWRSASSKGRHRFLFLQRRVFCVLRTELVNAFWIDTTVVSRREDYLSLLFCWRLTQRLFEEVFVRVASFAVSHKSGCSKK